ncbi:hypothetical protein [Halalkalibacter akibai]|uniref:Uncharacterized protein n=1 Tax=Halalkalibacter akibai (strain ATCC 43226 / DSM 21942 / CIP 109018 / JCM 9157 / 1139) TaxID=1236973 RepID=W4QXG7_HALA3|nr:hypothetical protein [Halalkalibacter akibai]GAE36825.1 hypothetical protein JCM9157_4045 [Halalkalibacter akibai JCM 9157]
MKRLLFLLFLCFALLSLVGFDSNKANLKVTDIEVTVIKSDHSLRYDFKIKNLGKSTVGGNEDYPGHHNLGLNIAVRPESSLAEHMEMEQDTKYKKMVPRGGGGTGFIKPGEEGQFHSEYQIKIKEMKDTDFKNIKSKALDATLIIMDGVKVIAEIPLNQ